MYAKAIFRHILTLGNVGDEVVTDIHPWLQDRYHMSPDKATRERDRAMPILKSRGLVHRPYQGCKLEILKGKWE